MMGKNEPITGRHELNSDSRSAQGLRMFLLYSLIFCAFTAGIFGVLILTHRNVMQFHDAYKQGAFRLVELRNQLNNILSGRGFSFWSWYEGPGLDEPLENFVDPCSILGALFPIRYLELGFTFAALLRMYLGGLAFMLMGRETGLNRKQILTGAILYVFSACFIGLALRQSEHLVNAYLFPLLVTTAERIYKKKSPLPFILTVAFYMTVSIYFAYMSAIVIVIYIALRYFAYNDEFRPGQYCVTMGKFIGYGITGMMIPAFTAAFSAFTIMRASTDSSNGNSGILFASDWYTTFGKMILGTGATYDYSDIGIPVLALLLIPIAIKHINRRSTNTIMFCILFVMMLIPFFCRMFNGFGYETFRWSYMLLLFAVWTGVEQLDTDRIGEKGSMILAAAGLAVIAVWTLGFYMTGIIPVSTTGKLFVPLQLAGGIAILGIFTQIRKKKEVSKRAAAAVLAVSFLTLSCGWSYGFLNNIENFARNSTVYNNLNKSALRAGRDINDDGFYRIDSVDAISRHVDLKFPSNENIWWKTNNLIIYNSRIPQTLIDFNVAMGNSYGYARRVYMVSNGNRMGMDFLYGVRYYLGSDAKNPATADSDNYAGYGFEKSGEIDGVAVFKNKYDVGLGFVCDKAMLKSEFDRLDRAHKEQVLMQAAVIPDDLADKCGNVRMISADEAEFEVKRIPFEITEKENLTVEDGVITAGKGGGSFTVRAHDIPDCQLLVSFDNLLRNSTDGKDGASFELYADDGKVRKTVINQNSRQGVQGLKDHDLSMGHVRGDEEVTVTLSSGGTYTFDDFYLSAMSTSFYDSCAERCMANRLAVYDYSDRKVRGTVDIDKEGILFLSIPAYDNWDIYVDGQKADRIDDMDIAFTGAHLSAGRHDIELRYNNRYVRYGGLVSVCGLLILLAGHVINRRKRS